MLRRVPVLVVPGHDSDDPFLVGVYENVEKQVEFLALDCADGHGVDRQNRVMVVGGRRPARVIVRRWFLRSHRALIGADEHQALAMKMAVSGYFPGLPGQFIVHPEPQSRQLFHPVFLPLAIDVMPAGLTRWRIGDQDVFARAGHGREEVMREAFFHVLDELATPDCVPITHGNAGAVIEVVPQVVFRDHAIAFGADAAVNSENPAAQRGEVSRRMAFAAAQVQD